MRIFGNREGQLGFPVLLEDDGLGGSATARGVLAMGEGRAKAQAQMPL